MKRSGWLQRWWDGAEAQFDHPLNFPPLFHQAGCAYRWTSVFEWMYYIGQVGYASGAVSSGTSRWLKRLVDLSYSRRFMAVRDKFESRGFGVIAPRPLRWLKRSRMRPGRVPVTVIARRRPSRINNV